MATGPTVYGDMRMSTGGIQNLSYIYFNSNSSNRIEDTGTDLWVKGNQGLKLWLNDSAGAIWVEDCSSFRPDATASNIDLGLSWARWRYIYVGSGGVSFGDGTIQTTAASGSSSLGDHDHSAATTEGGRTLRPLYFYMSTSSAARFRLPVGNNMY